MRGNENLQRIGRVLHLSSSNNLILKAENIPRIGEKVLDENLQQVGTVFDVFGPVSSPYLTVKPITKDAGKLVNKILYTPSQKRRKREKHE